MDPQQVQMVLWIMFWSGLAGLIIKFLLDAAKADQEITKTEFVIAFVVIGLVFGLAGTSVGWQIAKNQKKSFNEFWGGFEMAATTEPVACTKDGPCIHEYSCDPYTVWVEECSGSGDDRECNQVSKTKYHDCPVYTQETSYYVLDSFGQSHTIGNHCVDENPTRWGVGTFDFEANQSAPNACVGVPQFWTDANYRVNVIHQPGPAFKKNIYDNLILAADQELYKEYSGYVQEYLNAGMLPMVASPDQIHDFYWIEPIYFVDWKPENPEEWKVAIRNLNGPFGDDKKGFVHVVIVKSSIVDANPDRYATSLKSYWQDPSKCGDNCLAKNGVVFIIGTADGQTVSWAREITGMPVGNTYSIEYVLTGGLNGVALTPKMLIGDPITEFFTNAKGKLKVQALHPNPGAIESLVWGLANPETAFVRISMQAKDATDVGTGFKYLDSLIRPTKDQQSWIVFVCFVLSLGVWYFFAWLGERNQWKPKRRSSYDDYYYSRRNYR